jgi:SHS2 domain-containing protein
LSVYRWVEHTAEVQLAIEAGSEAEVYAEALAALAELLGFADCPGGEERRTLEVSAGDRAALLAAWLEELVYLAESSGFVATGVESISPRERELTATVTGLLDEPPPLVKAVTYHQLTFERRGDGYVANVVLDV